MREKKLVAHSSPNTIRGKVSEFYEAAKDEVNQDLDQILLPIIIVIADN